MDQKRTIIAIALSMAVLLGWQLLFAPDPPPEGVTADKAPLAATDNNGTGSTNGGSTIGQQPVEPTPTPTPTPVQKEIPVQDLIIKTDTYEATFTNRGARLKAFHILSPEQYVPRGDLMAPEFDDDNPSPGDIYLDYLPFGTTFEGTALALPETAMFEVVQSDETAILFRYTDPATRFVMDKRFAVNPKSPYSFDATVEVRNTSPDALTDALRIVMYGYQKPSEGEWSFFNPIPDISQSVCQSGDDIERTPLSDAAEGAHIEGPVRWGGVASRYFTTTAIAPTNPFAGCDVSVRDKQFVRTALLGDRFTLGNGSSQSWTMTAYIGPNKTDILEVFDVGLDRMVDYGIFEPICRPIHWLLMLLYGWIGNMGVAIIVLTLILRTLMFPINQKAYKSMDGMRRIQEPMAELKKKYENDPMKMNEKMMELYKTEGVSPFGCFPQLVQIPVFFALYRTIYNSVELYHANFALWYDDLSAPDPYYILPVLVAGAMFGQQLLMPTASTNPQMKYVMWAMPLMFAGFVFLLPSGLALYIITSTMLGIGQQYYIRRTGTNTPAPAKV